MAKYQDPIIVLGVGRCGTSIIAGLLQMAGVFIGEELTEPRRPNPRGYFEDIDFVQAHRGRIRGPGPKGTKDAWLTPNSKTPEWEEGIERLLKHRRSLGKPWSFKDPATCYFLDYWLAFHFKYPKMIWTRRDLFECQKSLLIWTSFRPPDEIPDEEVLQIMSKGFLAGREKLIMDAVKERDSLIVDFNELVFNDKAGSIDRIMEYAELNPSKKVLNQMLDFIEYPEREDDWEYLRGLRRGRAKNVNSS
jgi:hypothetical protein